APFEGDDNITFEIVDVPQELVEPQLITLADMNAGGFESQLVTVNNVAFQSTGSFQGGTNYDISDASGSGELRIDQNATDLVNAAIPAEPVEITGVVDRFAGTFQLKPRDSNDIEIEVFEPVGEDIPKDETFDVVTWNIEWFGSESNGPDDTELQLQNVITVVETIDADLYALQEIANEQRFNELVSLLDEYEGFWANYSNQVQNTAYLYKPSVIQFIDSGLLTTNQVEFDWAFRLPLFFEFNATVQGMTRHIFSYNVHAKALADQESYDRRTNASLRLKIFLDGNRANDNVLFIGDYNDRLITSTFDDLDSPYKNFVDDANYYTITKSLDERGLASFIAGQNRSMIDHITVTNDLSLDHIDGAERVENPNFIGSFISTTSDHAPVWTRFDFSRSLVSLEDEVAGLPDTFELQQNFPNPFNPSTNIAFTLSQADLVTIQVYDIMGRLVATVANGQQFNAGSHTVNFDATGLSSGMYIYRVNLGGGQSLSRKMTLIK
ncbi:MAG: T9SS type A sorting domain-containing protein, partial [Balneolaceae bacterium]